MPLSYSWVFKMSWVEVSNNMYETKCRLSIGSDHILFFVEVIVIFPINIHSDELWFVLN